MDIHWRNTQKPVRFFIFDARAVLAVFLFLVHIRLWTLMFAIFVMFMFWLLERVGLTFPAALRAIRCYLLGITRPSNDKRKYRYWTDFG